jgi:hypothetical protein
MDYAMRLSAPPVGPVAVSAGIYTAGRVIDRPTVAGPAHRTTFLDEGIESCDAPHAHHLHYKGFGGVPLALSKRVSLQPAFGELHEMTGCVADT